MNFLIITIDALSKWYIDQYKNEDGFFSKLEKDTLSMDNLYSTGPFTEAAIRGYWSGISPILGSSYLSETFFEKKTIFERFSDLDYYMYYGKLIPYFHYYTKCDNTNFVRERSEERAFEHIWNNRLNYYIQAYSLGGLKEDEYWKIQFILDEFFEKYKPAESVNQEREKYVGDKYIYIMDILKNKKDSSFFESLKNELYFACSNKNLNDYRNQIRHAVSENEALFLKKAKDKNIGYLIECNSEYFSEINRELSGTRNRCINSNNDLLSHMRDESEILPRLREEVDDFISWYDAEGRNIDRPFFAYIHNYDFHYPECFINARYDDVEAYDKEVDELCNEIEKIDCKKMSVAKQLCLMNIEKNLEYLWIQLNARKIFDDTCVIITADHGITNFMYSINPEENRWNYNKTNFNVPFYMKAPGVRPFHVDSLCSAKIVPKVLIKLEKGIIFDDPKVVVEKNEDFIFTAWINGIPDLERNAIKIGIRNKDFSITCQGLFTQVFPSLNITGMYDLNKDPDEIHSISYEDINDIRLMNLYNILMNKWVELVIQIITESDIRYDFCNKYSFVLNDIEGYKKWNFTKKIPEAELLCELCDQDVYIFGRGERTKLFLEKYARKCKVIEVWDNYTGGESFYFGHKLCLPHKADNAIIIICSRYEIDIINKLESLGHYNYITYDSIY